MPIICFEGASAAGKTTVAKFLGENFYARVIPEVNLLFERKRGEPQFWYFERQVERWQMASDAEKKGELVILDGDPFQPLWYNWAYDFDFGEPFEEIVGFYREAVGKGEIDFPEKYFILTIDESLLRERKKNDSSRTRKNFQRHLRFIKPQIAYFQFVKSVDERRVEFIENREVEDTARKIINSASSPLKNKYPPTELFDRIRNWLAGNHAGTFNS